MLRIVNHYSEVPPVLLRISWPALAVRWRGVPTVLGGYTILKLIWGGNLLYFPGFGDLQPYETWKFRICSESVSGAFPDPLRKCLTVLGAPPNYGGQPLLCATAMVSELFATAKGLKMPFCLGKLVSNRAWGTFLQTPAPVLDKISGPMGARLLGFWQPHREREQFFLQSGFSDAVLHYMRGFCRHFVVNFAVDFSVDFLSFV